MDHTGVKVIVAIFIIGLPKVLAAFCDETYGDPCSVNTPLPNMDASRNLSSTCTSDLCDKDAVSSNTWYRFEYSVIHTCPSTGCGSLIWFPEPIGQPQDGIREQSVYVKIVGDCRSREYTVFTKNCSHTTVLCLATPLTDCSERLVLDGNLPPRPLDSDVMANDESSDETSEVLYVSTSKKSSAAILMARMNIIYLSIVAVFII